MKSATRARPYRQRRRAQVAEANTARILEAALELFQQRPFDHITLALVAERAGVGLQTVIRRVGTKDGLARAVQDWIGPHAASARGEPTTSDPRAVAAAIETQYERWGALIDRTLRQEEVSPAFKDNAERGRAAHREWITRAFAAEFAERSPDARRRLHARLAAVTGVELWLVLRRDQRLSAAEARDAVADFISASLDVPMEP